MGELRTLRALHLCGRWRLVEPSYLGALLEMLLLSAAEHGWRLEAVPLADACRVLGPDGYRPELVRHCLEVNGEPAAAGEGAGTYALDQRRVCLHFARKLLQQGPPRGGAASDSGGGSRGWSRSQLLEAWAAAVPEEWSPPEAGLLAGEALEELPDGALPGSEPQIVPFAASDLPLEPAMRFAALFARRPLWERAALEPYLAGLVSGGAGQTVEALLLRYARASQSTPNAPIMFGAR